MVKVIEILGSGCANCRRLEANAREAVSQAGIGAEIRHVTDMAEIAARGILSTPGLAIDGRVVSVGRVPEASAIVAWLRAS